MTFDTSAIRNNMIVVKIYFECEKKIIENVIIQCYSMLLYLYSDTNKTCLYLFITQLKKNYFAYMYLDKIDTRFSLTVIYFLRLNSFQRDNEKIFGNFFHYVSKHH